MGQIRPDRAVSQQADGLLRGQGRRGIGLTPGCRCKRQESLPSWYGLASSAKKGDRCRLRRALLTEPQHPLLAPNDRSRTHG